jgi:adenosylcobinamide-GDP ribazoletransferase
VSGLLLAIRYLTILPVPGRDDTGRGVGRVAAWFPIVGLALGLLLVGVDGVTTRVFPPLLSALLTVTVWKLATGGLHLDGLADCLDGLMGRDREHRLAIMRDSRIGTFGAVGLILFLMLEIVAVTDVPPAQRWRVLVVAPTVARALPPLLARLVGAARNEGQGAAFVAGVRTSSAVVALSVAVLVSGAVLGVIGLVATMLALLVAVLTAWFLARRLGGLTGDVLGATVEGAELTVLLTVLAWLGARA